MLKIRVYLPSKGLSNVNPRVDFSVKYWMGKSPKFKFEFSCHIRGFGLVENRLFTYSLVGRKLRCLYSEWFTGKIVYFNSKMGKYRVELENNSEDYINLTDMSKGLQIDLLPDI